MAGAHCFNLVLVDAQGRAAKIPVHTDDVDEYLTKYFDSLMEGTSAKDVKGHLEPPKIKAFAPVVALDFEKAIEEVAALRITDSEFLKQIDSISKDALGRLAKLPDKQIALKKALKEWKKAVTASPSNQVINESLSFLGQCLQDPILRLRLLQEHGKSMHRLANINFTKKVADKLKDYELICDRSLKTLIHGLPESPARKEALAWIDRDVDEFAKACGEVKTHSSAGTKIGDFRPDQVLVGPDGVIYGIGDLTGFDFKRGAANFIRRLEKQAADIEKSLKENGLSANVRDSLKTKLAKINEVRAKVRGLDGDGLYGVLSNHDSSLMLSLAKQAHAERLEIISRFLNYMGLSGPMRPTELYYQQLDVWR